MRTKGFFAGFSLTEMAVVMASVAAVIVVTVGGANMVKKARVGGALSDVNKFARAVDKFEREYGGLPGDLADVSGFLSGATSTDVGNGNGVIDANERYLFWKHLSLAGLIEGDFAGGTPSVVIPGTHIPRGKIQGSGYTVVVPTGNVSSQAIILEYAIFSTVGGASLPIMSPNEAKRFDERLDNADPTTGRIRASNASGHTCLNGTNYDTSVEDRACIIQLHLRAPPNVANTGDESVGCGEVGISRVSPNLLSECDTGFVGKIVEVCKEDGTWGATKEICEPVVCEGDMHYGEKRLLACPEYYQGGGILQRCGHSGAWEIENDDCTIPTGSEPCETTGDTRVAACKWGQEGFVFQTCTGGVWTNDTTPTCTAIQCPTSIDIGKTRTGILNCPTNYNVLDVVHETCAYNKQYYPTFNTCRPAYTGSCTPDTTRSIGCPLGERGDLVQKCRSGSPHFWVLESDNCEPITCGGAAVGTARPSQDHLCKDIVHPESAGVVAEVCTIVSGDGKWELSTLNCTPNHCVGGLDTLGNATWPDAYPGDSSVAGTCLSGFSGSPVRSCNSSGQWQNPTVECTPDVTDIPANGLELWLDAGDADTLHSNVECTSPTPTLGSGKVACWKDKSGNDRHATQSTSGRQPTYKSLSGKSAIDFIATSAATADYLSADVLATDNIPDNPHTIIIVMQARNEGPEADRYFLAFNSASGNSSMLNINSIGELNHFDNVGESLLISTSQINNHNIFITTHSASTLSPYLNGVAHSTVVDTLVTDANRFSIGQEYDGASTSNYYGGYIQEIIVYNRVITLCERKQIEDYLGLKWGISVSGSSGPGNICDGLTVWFDAEDIDGDGDTTDNPADGATVTTWVNKADAGGTLPSVTNSGTPTYQLGEVAGKPIVRFDGSDYFVDSSVLGSDIAASNEASVFFVTRQASASGSMFFWQTTGTNRFQTHAVHGSGVFYFDFGTCCTQNAGRIFYTPSGYVGKWNYVSLIKRTNNSGEVFVNGTNVLSGTLSSALTVANTAAFYLGSTGATTHQGDIAELIIYKKALSTADQQAVEAYLVNKWGLSGGPGGVSANLELWLDAQDTNTLFTDSTCSTSAVLTNTIGCWKDKSVQGNDATQPSTNSNLKPQLITDSGRNVLDFVYTSSADGDYFVADSLASVSHSPFSIVVAMKPHALGGSYAEIAGFNSATGNSQLLGLWTIAGNPAISRSTIAEGTDALVYGSFTNKAIVLSAIATATTMTPYVNGVAFPTITSTINNTATRFSIGQEWDAASDGDFFDGHFYEIAVYSAALSDTDRRAVESYMGVRWNIDVTTFEPTDISGLQLWLDGQDYTKLFYQNNCTTAATDGGKVGCWKDKSTSNNDFINDVHDDNKPIYRQADSNLGSKSVLEFEGSDDYLFRNGSLVSGASDRTIFIVVKADTVSANEAVLSLSKPAGDGSTFDIDGEVGVSVKNDTAKKWTGSPVTGNYYIMTIQSAAGGATKDVTYYRNGTLKTASTAGGSEGINTAINTAQLGRNADDDKYFDGRIAEVIVYNKTLDVVDRGRIEQYLSSKYLITLP